MAITKQNTYEVGVNNDLTNALNNIDRNRAAEDLTSMFDDSGTWKVEAGSLIEANGNLWAVEGTPATPTGSLTADYVLYFDDSGPSFLWLDEVTNPPTYDSARNGWYESDRRRCRWKVKDIDGTLTPIIIVHPFGARKGSTESRIILLEGGDDVIIEQGLRLATTDYQFRNMEYILVTGSSVLYSSLFAHFDPYIPNTGDIKSVFGEFALPNLPEIISVYRTNATQMRFEDGSGSGLNVSSGSSSTINTVRLLHQKHIGGQRTNVSV